MKHILSTLLLVFLTAYACNRGGRAHPEYEVHGIDVSHYQSDIHWDSVAAENIQFAFVKATEGITLNDSLYCQNWEELKRVGITRGAYHFFRPSYSAKVQADHFIKNVNIEFGDLPPVLDVEVMDGVNKIHLLKEMYVWLFKVEIAYGIKPIIYTNQKFYNRYLRGEFEEYTLWIARYSAREPRLLDRKWDFWQYGNTGRINGIDGHVDFNVYRGTEADLLEMCHRPPLVLSMLD